MIFFIYKQGAEVFKILEESEKINNQDYKHSKRLWELAERYPDYIIGWCAEELFQFLNLDSWEIIFHHDLIMASFGINASYISDNIGYIDQLPFININPKVIYPTWKMSTNVGGVNGRVLMQFKEILKDIEDFGFLLNSVSKLGQQNGLFCYSAPALLKNYDFHPKKKEVILRDKTSVLFSFVFAHYKTMRVFLLFWCYLKYQKRIPVRSLLEALFQKKYFRKNVDLTGIELKSNKLVIKENSIDVIIPTLGRRDYLLQVMEDLKTQSCLPKKVIIIEQNSSPGSQTSLPELRSEFWPFEVVHHFINKTGACNARNLALEEVEAEWVFFADDDIRFNSLLLEQCISEMKRLGADSLNINCKQEGEETVFYKIKQWGSFGSGTSLVKGSFCKKLRFDTTFEYGFGEDQDFGMQLRNAGCDIIYHPNLEILHLKAPRGGFRDRTNLPWERDKPKPSPTLMLLAKKYYTISQLKGFKNEMFLRYYSKQKIKNPIKYIRIMRKRWRKSEEWADNLTSIKEGSLLKTK